MTQGRGSGPRLALTVSLRALHRKAFAAEGSISYRQLLRAKHTRQFPHLPLRARPRQDLCPSCEAWDRSGRPLVEEVLTTAKLALEAADDAYFAGAGQELVAERAYDSQAHVEKYLRYVKAARLLDRARREAMAPGARLALEAAEAEHVMRIETIASRAHGARRSGAGHSEAQ